MAKFNQGNLVLTSSQKIIQGGTTILDANGALLSNSLEVSGTTDLFALTVNDLAEIDSLEVTGTANFSTVSATGAIDGASITVAAGATIGEFSTDGTLSGDSDVAVPTEKAVKTYVDAQISSVGAHNNLSGLQGGEALEYYHLNQDIYESLYSSGSDIGIGEMAGANMEIDYGSNEITFNDSTSIIAILHVDGIEFFPGDTTSPIIITTDGVTGAVWG